MFLILLLLPSAEAGSFAVYNISQPGQTYFAVNGTTGYTGVGLGNPQGLLNILLSSGSAPAFNLTNLGSGNTVYIADEASEATPFVIDGSGNVLIGTTAPSGNLTVSGGNLSVSGGFNSSIDGSTLFVDAGNDRVGVGTASPGARLHVSGGDIQVDSNQAVGRASGSPRIVFGTNLDFYAGASRGFSLQGSQLYLDGEVINAAGRIILNPAAGSNAEVSLSGAGDFVVNTNQLYLDTGTGNLGIGTASPISILHAVANTSANNSLSQMLILDHATSSTTNGSSGIGQGILFRTEDSVGDIENISMIVANLTTSTNASEAGALTFFTRTAGGALAERVRIDGAGNTGIGTAAPNAKLEVAGAPSSGLSMNISNLLVVNQTSGNVGIGTTNPQAKLDVVGRANVTQNFTVNETTFHVDSLNARVGIGTTGPSYKLDVAGNVRSTTGFLTSYQQSYGTLDSGGAARDLVQLTSNTNLNLGSAALAQDFSFISTSGTVVTVKAAGNVGIGTTSPGAKLDVVGRANVTQNFTVNETTLHVDSLNARVGIGTTGPAEKLDVQGNLALGTGSRAQSGLIRMPNNAGFAARNAANTADIRAIIVGSNDLVILGTGATETVTGGKMSIGAESSPGTATLYVNGNVGIGTTSPQAKLDVVGRANITQNFTVNETTLHVDSLNARVGIGTTGPGTKLEVAGGQVGIGIRSDTTGDAFLRLSNGATSQTEYFWSRTQNKGVLRTSANIPLDFYANSVDESAIPHLRIATSGNVGIGTTSPISILHTVVNTSANDSLSQMLILDHATSSTTNGSSGIGQGILFRTEDSVGDIENISMIVANLTTSTNASEAGALAFFTRTGGGALTERVRIDGAGNVGIGTTGPTSKLQVVGGDIGIDSDKTIWLSASKDTGISEAAATGNIIYSVALANRAHVFNAGGVEVMRTINGNVGIGTTSPQAKLDVAGRANVTQNFTVNETTLHVDSLNARVGIGTTGPAKQLELWHATNPVIRLSEVDSGGNSFDISLDSNLLRFGRTDYSNSLTINSIGNVGIGTTSPQALLNIDSASAGLARLRITETGDTADGHYAGIDFYDGATARWSIVKTGSSHDLYFARNAGTMMTLQQSSGNVGIGTTGPVVKLEIAGTNGYPASTGSTDVGHMQLHQVGSSHVLNMGVADASPWGSWLQAQDTNALGTNYPLLLNPNGGNVGIGTTNPQAKLDVVGRANVTQNFTVNETTFHVDSLNARVGIGTTGPGRKLDIQTGATSNSQFRIGQNANDGAFFTSTLDNQFYMTGGAELVSGAWIARSTDSSSIAATQGIIVFNTNTGLTSGNSFTLNERMRITNAGNVGIGTTGPSYPLHVAGKIYNTNWIYSNNVGKNSFVLNSAGTNFGFIQNDAADKWSLGTGIDVDTLGTAVLTWTKDGNVGIGTTGPTEKLVVSGGNLLVAPSSWGKVNIRDDFWGMSAANVGGGQLRLKISASGSSTFTIGSTAAGEATDFTSLVTVKDNGNVGIGEVAPGSKLSVSGGATIGASYDTTAAPTNGMIIEGNVGIGTTSPQKKLDVAGSANVTQNFTVNETTLHVDSLNARVGIGTTGPGAKLQINTGADGTKGQIIKANSGQTANLQEWQTSAGAMVAAIGGSGLLELNRGVGAEQIRFDGSANTWHLHLTSDNTESLILTNDLGGSLANKLLTITNAGNVGIGTTGPGQKLEIGGGGNAYITGSIRADSDGNFIDLVDGRVETNRADGLYVQHGYNTNVIIRGANKMFQNSDGTSDWMRITTTGNVGIGTTVPGAKLEVAGDVNITTTFKLQPTDTPATCGTGAKGGLYFDDSLVKLCYCDGTNWCRVDTSACTSSTSCG